MAYKYLESLSLRECRWDLCIDIYGQTLYFLASYFFVMQKTPVLDQQSESPSERGLKPKLRTYLGQSLDRTTSRQRFYQQASDLEQDFQETRLTYDQTYLAEKADDLRLFQKWEPLDSDRNPEELAKHDFRQKLVAHLLAQREKVEVKFRQNFVVEGQFIVTSGQIIEAISEDLAYDVFAEIKPSSRTSLYSQLASSPELADEFRTGAAIFKLCQNFPHLDNIKIDLHNRKDLDLFYGHLIATFTGSGRSIWLKYCEQRDKLFKEIKSLSNREVAFPSQSAYGKLAEPMRIFLLQESLRTQIEAPESPSLAINMLEFSSNFGKPVENQKVMQNFATQPISNAVIDRLKSFFGKPTRRTILSELRRTLPGELPLGEIYQTVQNIHQLSLKTPQPNSRDIGDLAMVFLLGLEQILLEYNHLAQKEEGSPDRSGQALRYLVQKVRELSAVTTLAVK